MSTFRSSADLRTQFSRQTIFLQAPWNPNTNGVQMAILPLVEESWVVDFEMTAAQQRSHGENAGAAWNDLRIQMTEVVIAEREEIEVNEVFAGGMVEKYNRMVEEYNQSTDKEKKSPTHRRTTGSYSVGNAAPDVSGSIWLSV